MVYQVPGPKAPGRGIRRSTPNAQQILGCPGQASCLLHEGDGDRGGQRDLQTPLGVLSLRCSHRTTMGLGARPRSHNKQASTPMPRPPPLGQFCFGGPGPEFWLQRGDLGGLCINHKTQSPAHLTGQSVGLEGHSSAGVVTGLTRTQYTQKCLPHETGRQEDWPVLCDLKNLTGPL